MATEDFNPFDFSNEYPIEAPVAVDPQQFLPPREEAKAAPRGHNHTNLRMAYEYFLDKGLAPHQAAAIAGNIAQESGGHTRAEGGGKIANDPYSLGFAQWNRERLQGLQNFAAAQGAHATDPRIQLDYMWHELNTSEAPALKALLAANNLEDATHAFGAGYERPNEKYANYAGRINYARNVLQNAQANEAMGGGHPDVGPMRVVPVYDHDAKRAGQLAIPEGANTEDAIAALQQHGRRIEELITHPLVGNRSLTLPASANVNDALKKLQLQDPDKEWMTQEHAEKTGFGAGAASTFKSIPSLLQRGVGEIAEEFEPTRELGQEWIKSAKARQEELGKMYEAPLETDPMRTKLGYYGGAALGGLPLAAGAFVPGALGAAALGVPTALSAIGGTAQRFDEEGKPYSLADPATFAAAAGETGLQMVGMRGLNPAAGKFVESALKGAGGAALADIPSVALERLAAGQPLTSKEALEEYGGTAIGDIVGGGTIGGAAGKLKQVRAEEATQRPPGTPPPEGEITPELAPTHGEDQTIEDIAEEIRQQEPLPPMPERAVPPRLMGPEELPPEVAPPVEPMPEGPAPEVPPEMAPPEMPPEMAPPEAEIPEPVLRTPPERHELAEILDLKPSNDKRSLYQKLGQLDIRNRPEDLDKLDAYMNTTKMSFTPEQWQALEAHIDEVRNAHEIKKTAEPDAGSGPQPEVRQEGEGAPEGGEGIREGGPEGGPAETIPPQEVKHPGEALRQQWIDYFQNKHDDYVQRNPEKASGPVPAHFRNGIDQLRTLPPEKFFNEDGTPAPIENILLRDEQGGFAPATPPEKAEVPEPSKAPEAPEPVKAPEKPEAPELAEGEQGRKEFAERVGAQYKGPGYTHKEHLETPHNAALGEYVKAGNVEGALDELSKSPNPFHQKVAEHARRLKDVKLQANARIKKWGQHRVWYAPEPGKPKHIVDLRPDRAGDVDTVAHEFLHGLTVEAIHAPTAEQVPHVNALKNLYGKVKNHPNLKADPTVGPKSGRLYGVKNIYEFIAEGFSNPEFQHRLHQIELTKNVTAWDRFTQLIGKLIGVKKDTALTELTTHANRLLETVYKAESEKPATHGRGTEEPLVHGREDEDIADRAIREADETHRGSWVDRMQDKLSDAYTKFQTEVVSHKAPLERILGGQSMFRGADGEIRTKAKMAQSTHVGEITNESYKHGYIKRNNLGMNEVVHDSRLSLEKWREDFSALPDELREKFAEAINTLAMHGHNTRHAEHMDLFRVNQDHIDDAKALRDAVTRELKAMRASHEGSAKEFAQLLDVMDAANKDIVKREKLMAALKAKYKHVREIGEGKIFDVSDADAAEARRVLNSSPETRDLAARLRDSLRKDAELLRDNNVISEKTFEKFTDPKYDYAPRYMQMEELEEIFPDVGLYPGAGGQRRVGSPKRLKGGQHEVNILENLFRHRAKMAANAIHNNARLGALEDLARLDMAKKLPPNSTPTAKIQAVAALEKGKRVYYEVQDKSLYDAFSILHHMPFNGPITQYVTSATKTASRLMLVNPGYWFNQLMREPFMAATSTGMSFRHSLSLPFDTAATFASLLLDKSGNSHVLYNQLKAAGVTASHDYIRGRIKDELKDVIKPPANKIEASKKWLADTSKVAMRVHEYADAATKVATMKRLIQEAKSGRMTGERMNDEQARAAAISKVGEMLNLQARGRDTLVNYFNNTTPFFNTYIQGIDAIIRNATGHGMTEHEAKMARQTMRAHVLALTAFSTASAVALSLYSEAYRNAKPDDLLNNWVLPVGDGAHLLKAKAPFEFTVFKAIPEMIVRNALGLDTGESNWDHTSAQFWRNLAPPGFEALGIPFIMKPLAEAALNSTVDWTKGDFHPIASGDIAPAERGKGQTVFGDAISKMTGGRVSPAAVNHIVSGYAPELAQAINSTTNLASALVGTAFGRKDGKDITRDITETVPFLHDIMTNPNKMDASVRDFAQEQKMLKSTARYMQRRGMEGSEKYFKEGKYSIPAGRLDDVVSTYDTQIARIRNMGPFKDAQEAEKYAQKYQRLQEQKRAALAREKKFREKAEAKD